MTMFQKTEGRLEGARDVEEVDLRKFTVRCVYNFLEEEIPPSRGHVIVIVPDEEVLLQRIVMHHSIARHLRFRGLTTRGTPLRGRPKSGTCEIFYAEVPNWTPHGIVFSPERPLEIYVKNENERSWLSTGSVIALRRSRNRTAKDVMDDAERDLEKSPKLSDD